MNFRDAARYDSQYKDTERRGNAGLAVRSFRFVPLGVKFERARLKGSDVGWFLGAPDGQRRETGPYKDNEVRGPARFATGRFADFFSAGPRYFLRPYLNLRVFARRGPRNLLCGKCQWPDWPLTCNSVAHFRCFIRMRARARAFNFFAAIVLIALCSVP